MNMYMYVGFCDDINGNVFMTQLYAMVKNHLRAPYGIYFTKNRTILRSPYGVRPATGRIVRFFIIFRHRTVPGEVKVLLKIPRRPYGIW